MRIKELNLVNFRNYESLKIAFDKKNTIFIGDNAQGKTNILESIYFLSLTKSFFNVKDYNLIKFGSLYTKVNGIVSNEENDVKLEILLNNKEKKVKIDNNYVVKLSDYISKLNVVIFSPDNVRLLKESPNYRRKYLNIQISQLQSKYINILNEFNKILKQRNEYLKIISIRNDYDSIYLDIMNKKYSQLSVDIYLYRSWMIDKINCYIEDNFYKITGCSGLKVNYLSNIDCFSNRDEMIEKFYKKLNSNLKKDLLYKATFLGPQRDDFYFSLKENNLLQYGSQGQIRCAILALKFSEVGIFKEIIGIEPILLLDDIFSELDLKKRNNIIKYLSQDIQTIITTTDLNSISKEILNNSNVYDVFDGNVILHDERNDKND